jgi:hypothetical protein
MGAALGGAGLGVAPLWICHCRFLSYTLPERRFARWQVAELQISFSQNF